MNAIYQVTAVFTGKSKTVDALVSRLDVLGQINLRDNKDKPKDWLPGIFRQPIDYDNPQCDIRLMSYTHVPGAVCGPDPDRERAAVEIRYNCNTTGHTVLYAICTRLNLEATRVNTRIVYSNGAHRQMETLELRPLNTSTYANLDSVLAALPETESDIPKIYKTGVFLARMQPLHAAHMYLIEKALQECEDIWIVLGSANKDSMLRNPFTLQFREEVLKEALSEAGYSPDDLTHIHMFELPDWSLENDTNETTEWGRYFYYNVVSRIQHKNFTMYFSDDPAIIRSWFPSTENISCHVALRLFNRTDIYEGLSATRIRQAIIDNDKDYLSKYCPPAVMRRIDFISWYYRDVKDHPFEDFSMQ